MGSTIASITGSGAKGESSSETSSNFQNNPVNSKTPFGSVTYKQDEDGNWTQTTELSPNQQKMLGYKENFGVKAGEWANDEGRLNSALSQFTTPLDSSGLFNLRADGNTPLGQGLAQAFGMSTSAFNPDIYGRAYDTLLANYTQGMQTEKDRQQSNLAQQLANQGIRQGSTAYDRALNDFESTWYDNLNKAQQQAAADAYRYSMEDASLNNAATTQALQNAIAANNQQYQQQMLENTYLYTLLEHLMGNTFVTLPQGYTGSPLTGSSQSETEGSSKSSSGGLINAIGGFF